MPLLHHHLLTSDRIIEDFEAKLVALNTTRAHPLPSELTQFKKQLIGVFFDHLEKPSDEEMLAALEADARFSSNYPRLKEILRTLFTLKDTEDKTQALQRLKGISVIDWDTSRTEAQWIRLNQKHGYFDNSTPELENLFLELASACRTLIVLFEKNNTPDDTMAYEYAYKLMALFVDPNQPATLRSVIPHLIPEFCRSRLH